MNSTPEAPILSCLRLLKALHLSRRGKMRAAQALLAAEETTPQNLIELHALAALVTSEGDFPRALRLWRLLLEREPRHVEARRMIDSIELWLSRPPWVRYVPAGAVGLGLAVVVMVVVFSLSGSPPVTRNVSPLPAAPVALPQAGPGQDSSPPQTITLPSLHKRRQG